MGILIGISTLSMVEIIDLCFKIIMVIFTKETKVASAVSLGEINIKSRDDHEKDDNVDDDIRADDISDIFDADDVNECGNGSNGKELVYCSGENEYVYFYPKSGEYIYHTHGKEYVYFNNDHDGKNGYNTVECLMLGNI